MSVLHAIRKFSLGALAIFSIYMVFFLLGRFLLVISGADLSSENPIGIYLGFPFVGIISILIIYVVSVPTYAFGSWLMDSYGKGE